jgi:hypothetical protein
VNGAYIAVGEAWDTPGGPPRWYVVVWDDGNGPRTIETTHETPMQAWEAAQALRAASGLPVYLCNEGGALHSGRSAFTAALGMAGWGIMHTATGVWVADAYDDEGAAWQAAGFTDPNDEVDP